MKRNLAISFLLTLLMAGVMLWQGNALVTPVSRLGILDLEFAQTAGRLRQLQLFWNASTVNNNLLLDFLYILSYTWFFLCAFRYLGGKARRYGAAAAVSAALFDVAENLLLLGIYNQQLSPDLLAASRICAVLKFALAGMLVLFLLMRLPFRFLKRSL